MRNMLKNTKEKTYEYVVYVEDQPILKGKNLKKMLEAVKAKYKDKKISISWNAPEGVLIA